MLGETHHNPRVPRYTAIEVSDAFTLKARHTWDQGPKQDERDGKIGSMRRGKSGGPCRYPTLTVPFLLSGLVIFPNETSKHPIFPTMPQTMGFLIVLCGLHVVCNPDMMPLTSLPFPTVGDDG